MLKLAGTARLLPLGLAPFLLFGCITATPLPLTPLQVLLGGWPPSPPPTATAAARPYTIKGDTFAIPAINFAITRAGQKDWTFSPTPSGVAILLKQGAAGTEPPPALQVSVIPLPAGTDVAAALQGDLGGLLRAGAGVVTSPIGVDNLQGESWIITNQDPETNLTVRSWRVYVVSTPPEGTTGQTRIVLAEAKAEPNTFLTLLPQFERMLGSLAVPRDGDRPVDLKPGLVRADSIAEPLLGLTIQPIDPRNWLSYSSGGTLTLERRSVPEGGTARPQMSILVGQLPQGTDLTKFLAEEKAKIETSGVSITASKATVDGREGDNWEWRQPGTPATINRRITILDAGFIYLVTCLSDEGGATAMKAEFDALLGGLKIPKANTTQQATPPTQ